MRRPYVVGNWKMNTSLAEARALVQGLLSQWQGDAVDVGIAPPAVWLLPMHELLSRGRVVLGAQNVYDQPNGAFTGELSVAMIKECGCDFVIIGHSERRQHFSESSELLQRKIEAALAQGLQVIYCIGETLDDRSQGRTEHVLEAQLQQVLKTTFDLQLLTIAYEPVWAIGTGQNATPDQAQQAHAFIRQWLLGQYGQPAQQVRLQYGGSVKPNNASALLGMPDVDGALVGGASLNVDDFIAIIHAAQDASEVVSQQ